VQEEKTTKVKFADTLKGLMRARGISQVDLAKYLGVTQAAVSKWMRGSVPRGELFTRLAAFFEVPSDYLLTGKEELRVPKAPSAPQYHKIATQIGKDCTQEHITGHIKEEAEKTFPQRLRWLRESLGLSIQQFGKKCGYSPGYISRLEGAKRVNPSWKFVDSLVGTFSVNRDWIEFGLREPFVTGKPNVAQSTVDRLRSVNEKYRRDQALYLFKTVAEQLKTSALIDLMQIFWREADADGDAGLYREALAELSRIQTERLSGAVQFDENQGLTLDHFFALMNIAEKFAKKNIKEAIREPDRCPPLLEDAKRYFEAKRDQYSDVYPIKADELETAVKVGIPVEKLRIAVNLDEQGRALLPPVLKELTSEQEFVLRELTKYWNEKAIGQTPEIEPPHLNPDGSVSEAAIMEYGKKKGYVTFQDGAVDRIVAEINARTAPKAGVPSDPKR
jgi:transcriptional regulator with XRE-family HTH domain